jgi:hypothetical protein
MTVRRGVLTTTAFVTMSVALAGQAAQGVQARPGSSAPAAVPTRVARAAALPATFVAMDRSGRVGEFRVRDGRLLRYLSTAAQKAVGPKFSRDRAYVYYSERQGCGPLVRVRPGRAGVTKVRAFQSGGVPIAVGDGKALASNTCKVASMLTFASDASGRMRNVLGLRQLGATSLSYAPGSQALALSAYRSGIYVTNLRRHQESFNAEIPCPAALRRCETRAGEYGPDGRLWFVASTKGRGAKAYLAYYVRGRSYLTTTRLPKASRFVFMSAARSGALLISGVASDLSTRSEYVVSWDGRTLRRHTTAVIEPSW